jgi:hypothetical protein
MISRERAEAAERAVQELWEDPNDSLTIRGIAVEALAASDEVMFSEESVERAVQAIADDPHAAPHIKVLAVIDALKGVP